MTSHVLALELERCFGKQQLNKLVNGVPPCGAKVGGKALVDEVIVDESISQRRCEWCG